MALQRPSVNKLMSDARALISAETDTGLTWLARSLSLTILKAVSGVAHGLYGAIDYKSKQIVPGFATDPDIVAQHAELFLNEPWKQKAPGNGPVDFTGTDGRLIPKDRILQRADGVQYKVDADAQIAAGVATANVTAVLTDTTTGQDTNALTGLTLTLVQPIAGVNSIAVVGTGGIVGGADKETVEQVNARIRTRLSSAANGSNATQYVVWALEIPGVTRAWCLPQLNGVAGTVGLSFVRDGDENIVPDAAEVQAMQDYIEARHPAQSAGFTAFAPTLEPQAMTIQLSPNTVDVQQATQTALQALFDAADVEDGNGAGVIPISHVCAAISTADGEDDHIVVSPTGNIVPAIGGLATLGTITWQGLP